MRIHHVLFIIVLLLAGGAVATAQELGPGAGTLEVGGFPGGGLWLVSGDDDTEVNFNNWSYGGGLSWYLRPRVAVEAEAAFGLGLAQGVNYRQREVVAAQVPNTLGMTGNVVFFPGGSNRRLAPYVTGGAGTLTLISRNSTKQFGVTDAESFLTTNLGGGVKLFRSDTARNWGFRVDYRLVMVNRNSDAVPFFARSKQRLGHRLYAGMLYVIRR